MHPLKKRCILVRCMWKTWSEMNRLMICCWAYSRLYRLWRLFVPERRLELLHLAARVPETRASTNSAIRAFRHAQTSIKKILLDLLVQGMTLHVGIVLLQDKTFCGIFLVFCGGISGNCFPLFFCLSAFKGDNDSVFFSFCHGNFNQVCNCK